MTHLYIDLSEYIPDPEVEAVDKAISILMNEEYDFYDSKMNKMWNKIEQGAIDARG